MYVLHDAIAELKNFLGHRDLSKEAYYQPQPTPNSNLRTPFSPLGGSGGKGRGGWVTNIRLEVYGIGSLTQCQTRQSAVMSPSAFCFRQSPPIQFEIGNATILVALGMLTSLQISPYEATRIKYHHGPYNVNTHSNPAKAHLCYNYTIWRPSEDITDISWDGAYLHSINT